MQNTSMKASSLISADDNFGVRRSWASTSENSEIEQDDSVTGAAVLFLPFNGSWQFVVGISTVFTVFAAIYDCVYEFYNPPQMYIYIRYVCDVIYLVDTVLFTLHRHMTAIQVTRVYLPKSKFLLFIDYVTLIPMDLFYDFIVINKTGYYTNMINLLRLPNVLRVYRLQVFYADESSILNSDTYAWWSIVCTFIVLQCLISHLVAAVWYYLACKTDCEYDKTWALNLYGKDFESENKFSWFLWSFFFVFGVSAHNWNFDIRGENNSERFLIVILMYVGLSITYALLYGRLIVANLENDRRHFAFVEKMELIKAYMQNWDAPKELQEKTFDFYETFWKRRSAVNTAPFFKKLPLALQKEVSLDQFWEALVHSHLFSKMDVSLKRSLCLNMKSEILLPGENIYQYGVIKTKMVYIVTGVVQILSDEDFESPVASFSSGTLLGELSIILPTPSTANVKCASYCEIHTLDMKGLFEALKNYPKKTKQLLTAINDRVRYANNSRKKASLYSTQSSGLENLEVDKDTLHNETKWLKERYRRMYNKQTESESVAYEDDNYWKIEAEKTQEELIQHTSQYVDLYAFSDEVELKTDTVCIEARFPWILEKNSPFQHGWEIMMLIVVLLVCLVIPYHMAFSSKTKEFLQLSLAFRVFYLIDLWIQCTTAIKTKDIIITDICAITRYRLKQVAFLVDVISAIPLEFVLITMVNEDSNLALLGNLNFMLRVYKLFLFVKRKEKNLWIDIATVRIFKFIVLYMIAIYWLAALLYMTACTEEKCTELSWYGVGKKRDLQQHNKLVDFQNDFVVSLFFSFSLITNTGIPNVYAENTADVLVCLFAILISLILGSYSYTELTATWITQHKPRAQFQSLISEIHRFAFEHQLTPDLVRRIDNFLIFQWLTSKGSNIIHHQDVFHEVPQDLKESISNFRIKDILKQVPLFEDADPNFLNLLVRIAKCHTIPPNGHMTVSGVRTTNLVIVRRGYCVVKSTLLGDVAGNSVVVAGPGSHFPVIEFLQRTPVFVSVKCITCCEIISFDYYDLINTMKLYANVYKEIKAAITHPDMDLTHIKYVKINATFDATIEASQNQTQATGTSNANFFRENEGDLSQKLQQHNEQYILPFLKLGRFHFIRFFLLSHGIYPESRFLKCWEISRAFFAVSTLIITPMIYCAMAAYEELHTVGLLLDATAYIDIIVRFNVAYYSDNGILISHPLYTAHHYLTHAFSVDLFGCFPFKLIPLQRLFGSSNSNLLLHLALVTSRGLQVYRFIGFCKYLESDIRRVQDYITVFRFLILLLLLWHYIANLVPFFKITYIFDDDLHFVGMEFPPNSWMYNEELYDVEARDTLKLYLLAIYFAASTFTATMIGSLRVTGEDGMSMFLVIAVGLFFLRLVFFASISSMHMVGNINLTKYQERMKNLVSFLKNEDTDKELLQKSINNFEHDWLITRGTNVYNVFTKFHAALLEDVTYHLYSNALTAVDIFLGADNVFFRSISKHVKVVHQKPGAVIIKFNQFEDTIYIINKGRVSVQGPNIQGREEIIQRGCVFGNLDIFKIPARYTAIAYHTVELLTIPNTLFYSIIEDHEVLKKRFLKALGENRGYIGQLLKTDAGKNELTTPASSSSQNVKVSTSMFRRLWTKDMLLHKIGTVTLNLFLSYTSLIVVLFHIGLKCNAVILRVIIYSIDVLYLLKIYFGFSTAYEDKTTGLLVFDFRKIAKRYARSWFLIDLISLLPLEVFALALNSPTESMEASYWLKLNRTLRIAFLSEYFHANLTRVNVSNYMRLVEAFVWNTLAIETMACLFMMVSCYTEHCYYSRSFFDLTPTPTVSYTEKALLAQLYTLNLVIGTGFRDVVPYLKYELVFELFCMIVIQFVSAHSISCIASFTEITSLSKSNYRHDVLELHDYLKDRDLSQYLRSKTITYALQLWLRAKGEWLPVLLQQAPTYLREDLMLALYAKHLRHNMLFSGTHDDFLSQLAAKFDRCVFFPGDYIVERGDVDGNMYFIHDGVVEVVHRNKYFVETLVETIRTDQAFSIAQGLYKNKPHIHIYRAKTVVDLIILNRNKCHDTLKIFPSAALYIYGKAQEIDFTL